MDVTLLLNMLRTGALGSSTSASGVRLTEGQKLDPTNPPDVLAVDVSSTCGST